jgi:hypothetical protein
MITAVDTAILLDVPVNEPAHADRSGALLFPPDGIGPVDRWGRGGAGG